jgi:alkanesulfonate monooxygenase SsuD/methylene tetrahydromethanopterin reductase-like flavin-dependent oxidoreductase (luciferase family)
MTVGFGVYINNRAAVFMGEAFSMRQLLENAVAAEQAGFDFVSVGDSILAKPRYSPVTTLAAVAGRTSRIGLATGILQPHMRHPVILAQDWATLDEISGGRTEFGVGLGTGDPEMVAREYELIGLPKSRRGAAFDESIRLIKRLWTEDQVTFKGEIFSCADVTLGYRPRARPHPPVLVACGGFVPKQAGFGPNDFYTEATAGKFVGPFDRVARLGDGWITGIATAQEYRQTLELISMIATERYQRTLDERFIRRINLFICVGPDDAAAHAEGRRMLEAYHQRPFDQDTLDRWLLAGPPQACAERLLEYVAAGANSFQMVIASYDQRSQIEALAAEVLPRVRSGIDSAPTVQ